MDQQQAPVSAFIFHGHWREFLPIAVTNLLLTVVTLGIYRFWATTRERQYLWAESEFIDERLEWTGTGLELFIGAVLVLLLFGGPFLFVQFGAQALALQGYQMLAGALTVAAFASIFYLTGVARFRALRYRLGRTYWRGIRGGSDEQGFAYGWSWMWKSALGILPLGLLIPWSMVELWNERWNAMSFGPHRFRSTAEFSSVMKRFLLFYLSPIIMVILIVALGLAWVGVLGAAGANAPEAEPSVAAIFGLGLASLLIIYLVIPAIWLVFYAKFYRVVVEGMSLHTLDFQFRARTKDWLILIAGDALLWLGAALVAALPVVSAMAAFGLFDGFKFPEPGETNAAFETSILLGSFAIIILPFLLVGPFIRYRHWKFFITNMEATGEINLDELTQSITRQAGHGEGLLDAFDVGAI